MRRTQAWEKKGESQEGRYGNAKILRQNKFDSTMAFLLIPVEWKGGWAAWDGSEKAGRGQTPQGLVGHGNKLLHLIFISTGMY